MSDSYLSYDLAIASLREIGVRAGVYAPRNDEEARQQAEGPKFAADLDCVKQYRGNPIGGTT